MEREIIFGLTKSYRLYRESRDILCVFDPKKALHRRDFTVRRYNTLYRAIDAFYRRFDRNPPPNDFGIPVHVLSSYVIDWANRNKTPMDEAQLLYAEIQEALGYIQDVNVAHVSTLLRSDGFRNWLGGRILDHTLADLNLQQQLGYLTVENMHERLVQIKAQMNAGMGHQHFVNGGSLLYGTSVHRSAFASGIERLDKAMGGGFRRGGMSLIAGANAGGKTVLASQLAYRFAYVAGLRTVVCTTEQRPSNYICRIASNHLSVEYKEFVSRQDLSHLAPDTSVEVSIIPEWIHQDPNYANAIADLHQKLIPNLMFMDWSHGQGMSIQQNLDPQIDEMERLGWSPDVIIFDWIGGGLEQNFDKSQIRHYYKAAADHLVAHAKRTDRAIIALAQLDKSRLKGTVPRITTDMLSECKTMTDNAENFIGISSIREAADAESESPRLAAKQFLYVDKPRYGPGGSVPVRAMFQFQRFAPESRITGGQ